jgi:asparagine synthase (glutamine-hydrolysing)
MCGIVGVLGLEGRREVVREDVLTAMRDTLTHRGPDDAGLWIEKEGRVGFGHRRLAIIEPTASAHQPMATVDGRYRLVFNGEIYNHAELRCRLVAAGRTNWRTDHSDTEVLLQAFAHWGIGCLEHLRGMFAFAVWDERERALWLARDRIGVKPLYVTQHHGRFAFASEIKALLADPDQPRAVDERALWHYLSFLCTPAPATLFRGIGKLAPGTWMRVCEEGTRKTERWWDVWDHVEPLTTLSDDAVATVVLDGLRDAVRSRKVSDVPVGVFLSGGIDSSANATLFSENDSDPVRTFTIGYRGTYESYENETGRARALAEHVGAEHHERFLEAGDLLDFTTTMVHHQDEPIADPVCVPLYFVSKLARDNGVVVCQVGEGADELFVGYPGWLRVLTVERWSRIGLKGPARSLGRWLVDASPWRSGTRFEYLRRAVHGEPVFWSGAGAFTEGEKAELVAPSVRQRLGDVSSLEVVEPIWQRFREAAWDPSPVNWMAYVDLNLRLPELLLMRVDKMSMAASLEARVPFLDHHFVAMTLSIPADVRFRDKVPKAILKRALRGVVSDEIIDRKKQGFGLPLTEWYADQLADHIQSQIRRFTRESGLLTSEGIERVLVQGETARIWVLYNLAVWWLSHFSARAPQPSLAVRI